ncbi:MAG TPA: hypothetical protein VGF75_07555, partial [Candidatus Saccharimonadales bacterium]
MPGIVESLDSVDLSKLTGDSAVVFIGHYEDGRKINLSVDVFHTLGNFAYGMTLSIEEKEAGRTVVVNPELTMLLARLPLKGELTPGSVNIEIAD